MRRMIVNQIVLVLLVFLMVFSGCKEKYPNGVPAVNELKKDGEHYIVRGVDLRSLSEPEMYYKSIRFEGRFVGILPYSRSEELHIRTEDSAVLTRTIVRDLNIKGDTKRIIYSGKLKNGDEVIVHAKYLSKERDGSIRLEQVSRLEKQ